MKYIFQPDIYISIDYDVIKNDYYKFMLPSRKSLF